MKLQLQLTGLLAILICLSLNGLPGEILASENDQLRLLEMRAERRAANRTKNTQLAKSAQPGQFSLLVIPVDFRDARLPESWTNADLSRQLNNNTGESLRHYFEVASYGKLSLQVTLAPLVHLIDTRRLYSDRDLNGNTRTRKLAAEAITAARDYGLQFRLLDNDGPDGLPGSEDDDGQVDGVLILHAAPGTENDPETGLIQALQFFLKDPILQQGVAASFYAVASLQSGIGIWAHETAHLLGMEDRYDWTLPTNGASEALSRGGLGQFSLMASGAWGTGGGSGAALPDAYSSSQLGWLDLRDLQGTEGELVTLRPGEAGRLWTQGVIGPEFYLLETRDKARSAPFDAALPSGQLMIIQVDENLPELQVSVDGGGLWHLRTRLVEADDDRGLARGEDQGRAEDLFPGPLAVTTFGPYSAPSSWGYNFKSSRVTVSQITADVGEVHFTISVDISQSLLFNYSFDLEDHALQLDVRSTGDPLSTLQGQMTATSLPAYGQFESTGSSTINFSLQEISPRRWQPVPEIFWQLDSGVMDSEQTRFHFQFTSESGPVDDESRWWTWRSDGEALNIRGEWPGSWTIAQPDGDALTTWHRWDTAPWLTANQDLVLACVDAKFPTSSQWPDVTYWNRAFTTLTSAPINAQVMGVRLTHSISIDMTGVVTPVEGGLIVWLGPDDIEREAVPVEGYGQQIDAIANSALHGQKAFADPQVPLLNNQPTWRTDTFVLPTDRPGPWQLRFKFASDPAWRARGWFIADIEPLFSLETASGFVPAWQRDLSWYWPWRGALPTDFKLEMRAADSELWQPLAVNVRFGDETDVFAVEGSQITAGLEGGAGKRHQIRVIGTRPAGRVASQAVVVYPDGGSPAATIMSAPWPNPSAAGVSLMLEVPDGQFGHLKIYDLRGRLIKTMDHGPGQQLIVWDGRSDRGGRVASGIYYIRLEGTGPVLTRKVVLIH